MIATFHLLNKEQHLTSNPSFLYTLNSSTKLISTV